MKTTYTPPDIEIVALCTSDIISTSYGKEDEEHGGFGGEWDDW